jgi:hypothetical protein
MLRHPGAAPDGVCNQLHNTPNCKCAFLIRATTATLHIFPMTDQRSWRNARYHCEVCQRPFDRRDVLSRHMHTHGRQRAPMKPRRRACISCSQSKVRCNGQHPSCDSCQRRHRDCIWTEPLVPDEAPAFEDISSLDSSFLEAPLLDTLAPSIGNASSSTPTSYDTLVQGDVQQSTTEPRVPLIQHAPELTSPWSDTQAAPLSDWALSGWQGIDFTSTMDWFWTTDASDDTTAPADVFSAVTGPDLYNRQLALMSAPQTTFNSARQSEAGDGAVRDEAESLVPTLNDLLSPQPQALYGYGELWPLAQPGPPSNQLSLPSLTSDSWESGLYDQFNSIMSINDRTWHALQRCLWLPFEHNSLQTLDLGKFPVANKLDHCIDLYFTHFNPTLPIIHQATFDPGRDLLVTLAVINIGACYTDFDEASSFSAALSDLIRRLLLFTAEQDHRFVRSAPYVTAKLLQGVRELILPPGQCSMLNAGLMNIGSIE